MLVDALRQIVDYVNASVHTGCLSVQRAREMMGDAISASGPIGTLEATTCLTTLMAAGLFTPVDKAEFSAKISAKVQMQSAAAPAAGPGLPQQASLGLHALHPYESDPRPNKEHHCNTVRRDMMYTFSEPVSSQGV